MESCEAFGATLEDAVVEWFVSNGHFNSDANNDSNNYGGSARGYALPNVRLHADPDEGLLLAEGGRLYAAHGTRVSVVDMLDPSGAALLGSWDAQEPVRGLVLEGDVLLVVSWAGLYNSYGEPTSAYYQEPLLKKVPHRTRVTWLDVSDPAAPSVLGQTAWEGFPQQTRRVGERLQVVSVALREPSWRLKEAVPWPEGLPAFKSGAVVAQQEAVLEEARVALRPAVREALEQFSVEDWLLRGQGLGEAPKIWGSCEEVYAPEGVFQSFDRAIWMTHLVDVPLDPRLGTQEPGPKVRSVLGRVDDLYATPDALYMARTVLRSRGISTQLRSWETHLHRFSGDLEARYEGSVALSGALLQPGALQEEAGLLRALTVEDSNWYYSFEPAMDSRDEDYDGDTQELIEIPSTHHRLSVLRPQEGQLQPVGSLADLAPRGQSSAVLFEGPRAYISLSQAPPEEPLEGEWVMVSLDDPAAPSVLEDQRGALPPLGVILPSQRGLFALRWRGSSPNQLEMFELAGGVASEAAGLSWEQYSGSDAQTDARLLARGEGLWALPATGQSPSPDAPGGVFRGVVVVGLDEAGRLGERGWVDHREMARALYCPQGCEQDEEAAWPLPHRSLFAGERLYVISEAGLSVHSLADLSAPLAELPWGP